MSSMRKSKRSGSSLPNSASTSKGKLAPCKGALVLSKSQKLAILEAELIGEEIPQVKRTKVAGAVVTPTKGGFGFKAVAAMVVVSILGGSLLMNMNKGAAQIEDLCNIPQGQVENIKGEVVALSEGMTANEAVATIAAPSSNCSAKISMRTGQVNFKSGDVIKIAGSSDGFGIRADRIEKGPMDGFKANGQSVSNSVVTSLHTSMFRSTFAGDGTYTITIQGQPLLVPGELAGKVSSIGFQDYQVTYSGGRINSIEMM